MFTHASSAEETPHSAIGYRGRFPNSHQASAALFGPALTTETPPNSDGLVLLQARRLVLLREAARLRNLRKAKASSICERELRAVTNEILNTRRRTDA